ncbi:MAG: hypothetical protein A3I66_14575 [Burkholderiales bacterium RIFCSPLOWO2_02_FULL_57_36]|nr:MAG: hypothetical protein A3I66_14575 [Burkholderiales bacterium RIFCSPLOWO2_02_FULL_57_36]
MFRLILVFVLIVAAIIGILMLEFQSDPLMYFFFGWAIIGAYLAFKVKCPRCGVSVAYQGTILGLPLYAGDLPVDECKHCGFDLTKPLKK